MITTAQHHSHSKRRTLGIAVMAMATFHEARAQRADNTVPESTAKLSVLPELAAQLAASPGADPQLELHERITAIETSTTPVSARARQQQIDALLDLGLRYEGSGRGTDAVHTLEQAEQLATDAHARFVIELALAHASQQQGNDTAWKEHCAAAHPENISNEEIRRHVLGNRSILVAQKELFCSNGSDARAVLAKSANHAAVHQVLSEYDLATGDWVRAEAEYILWRNSPEILQATTHH